jgi:hypothetical protein
MQAQNKDAFDRALEVVKKADQTFIDAVNAAILAGNQQYGAALTDLIAAVDTFYQTVSSFKTSLRPSAEERAKIQC